MSLLAAAAFILMTRLATAQSSTPAVEAKFEPETFYLVIMNRASSWDGKKAEALSPKQKSYWQSVADKKAIIAAGPTTDEKDRMAAVMILRIGDRKAAEEVAKADPFVEQKLWSAQVYPWMTQKDLFGPIKYYEPAVPYYLGFLKRGDKWSPEETPERQRIQDGHMANIRRLHEMGKLVAAGPFLEDGDLRGIFVFKVATMDEALALTNTDPAVQAGRLRIELHPWVLPKEALVKSAEK
jgi:uncharacterized protein YciI